MLCDVHSSVDLSDDHANGCNLRVYIMGLKLDSIDEEVWSKYNEAWIAAMGYTYCRECLSHNIGDNECNECGRCLEEELDYPLTEDIRQIFFELQRIREQKLALEKWFEEYDYAERLDFELPKMIDLRKILEM